MSFTWARGVWGGAGLFLSLHSGVCRCLSEPLHLCKLAPMLGGHGFPCLCLAPSTPGHPSLAWSYFSCC